MGSLIDIHPEEVRATETYSYETVIGSNDFVKESDYPKGHIIVYLPYDGEKHFPRRTAEELRKKENLQALKIGSVAMGEPKDWKGDWKQQTGFELLDVELPLRTTKVTEEQWTADELWMQCSHEYSPEPPGYFPIQVHFQVLDRYAIHPLWLAGKGYKEKYVWTQLAEASSTLVGDNILSFEFLVRANLPSILGGRDLAVCLETLRIAWPGIPPRNQFRFSRWDPEETKWVPLKWDYDPAGREILLKDIRMDPPRIEENPEEIEPSLTEKNSEQVEMEPLPGEKNSEEIEMELQTIQKNGNPLTTYEATIYVKVLFASGKLLEEDRLGGKAIVRVDDTLLSGRDVAWMQASGARAGSNTPVTKQTFLKSEFDASLSEQFNEKRSFIFRHWVFPGVTRQTARENDVIAILLDMGYSSAGPGPGEGKIVGKREVFKPGQEPSDLYVWIELAEELTISTTRERKLAEAETYRTEISTRVLAINFYAQMDGDGGLLARDAENLMQRLKEQFAAVADLR